LGRGATMRTTPGQGPDYGAGCQVASITAMACVR
jgi:hypothetical protein